MFKGSDMCRRMVLMCTPNLHIGSGPHHEDAMKLLSDLREDALKVTRHPPNPPGLEPKKAAPRSARSARVAARVAASEGAEGAEPSWSGSLGVTTQRVPE